MDDLRDLQHFGRPMGENGLKMFDCERRLPCFLSQTTYKTVAERYSYIVNYSRTKGPKATKVAEIDFQIVDDSCSDPPASFKVGEEMVTALPVVHGEGYTCLGLMFGSPSSRVVFLSDVSRIPEETEKLVEQSFPIKMLIIDALYLDSLHPSHFSLLQTLDVIERWEPQTAYVVGVSCQIGDHDERCAFLEDWLKKKKEERPSFRTEKVALSHDGLFVPLSL